MNKILYLKKDNIFVIATTAEDTPEAIKEACKAIITQHDINHINDPDPKSKASINDSHPSTIPFWKEIEKSELPKFGLKTRVIWKAYEQKNDSLVPIRNTTGKHSILLLLNNSENNNFDAYQFSTEVN